MRNPFHRHRFGRLLIDRIPCDECGHKRWYVRRYHPRPVGEMPFIIDSAFTITSMGGVFSRAAIINVLSDTSDLKWDPIANEEPPESAGGLGDD